MKRTAWRRWRTGDTVVYELGPYMIYRFKRDRWGLYRDNERIGTYRTLREAKASVW